jgi:hypothetical protein
MGLTPASPLPLPWYTFEITSKYQAIQGATYENAILSFVPALPFRCAASFSSSGNSRIPA